VLSRLLEVGDEVVDVLEADRDADQVVGVTPVATWSSGRELLVRGGGRMDDQRLGVADVGEQAEELDRCR
jgi:hypothetical protein